MNSRLERSMRMARANRDSDSDRDLRARSVVIGSRDLNRQLTLEHLRN